MSLASASLLLTDLPFSRIVAAVGSETELPIPPFGYALIAFLVFLFLAFVVWSFRDVANRHSHKTGGRGGHGAGHSTAEHD